MSPFAYVPFCRTCPLLPDPFAAFEGANLIKIHRRSGKLAYLMDPDFESDPDPALRFCVKLNLRTRSIECYDYAHRDNPPILHRKEMLLHPEHPLFAKFARLTRQEEQHGLLTDTATIGTRAGWTAQLEAAGFALRGHRLVRRNAGSTAEEDTAPRRAAKQ
jgi:DNA phosphorothioation-associated putative methyltransferase